MGYKFDENNNEWVTTEEWNQRNLALVGTGILMCLCALILPARILKFVFGYGFMPDEFSVWQMTTDVCISVPIYLVIIVILVAFFGQKGPKP